jgi:hypothetical protein
MSVAGWEITEAGILRTVPPFPDVDLWIACLAEDDVIGDYLGADDGERVRASRIVVPARRRSFLFRRAVQRNVLGKYLKAWQVEHGGADKPRLGGAVPPLHFSASSSGRFCAVAISAEEVGVDIAATEGRVALAGLCKRFVAGFTEPPDIPDAVRRRAGQWSWTRFEAGLKLRGEPLLDALTGRAEPPCGRQADLMVAGADFVCAVAKAVPFRLALLEFLPFMRIAARAG